MPKIVAHSLVKNEARWIWFSLMSVLDFFDEILVWDTGSTDSTPEIIKSISSPKIKFKQIGEVTPDLHTAARQQMLQDTDADWILILDGDEIWYSDSLLSCIDVSIHRKVAAIISPFINLVGDVYHYQSPARSRYIIGPYCGAYNIRFINRKILGLHVANPHGRQEYRDDSGTPVQNFPPDKLAMVDKPYLHLTHLFRSASPEIDKTTLKRGFKYRYELGHRFANDFVYPEVFYLPRPEIVPDPWVAREPGYIARSVVYEPARIIKKFFYSGEAKGY